MIPGLGVFATLREELSPHLLCERKLCQYSHVIGSLSVQSDVTDPPSSLRPKDLTPPPPTFNVDLIKLYTILHRAKIPATSLIKNNVIKLLFGLRFYPVLIEMPPTLILIRHAEGLHNIDNKLP